MSDLIRASILLDAALTEVRIARDAVESPQSEPEKYGTLASAHNHIEEAIELLEDLK